MDNKTRIVRQLRSFGLIFAIYTFYITLQLPQIYFYNVESAKPLEWWISIGRLALASYIWAFLSPFVIYLGGRFPIRQSNFLRNLALHLFFGIICGVIQVSIYMFGLTFLIAELRGQAFYTLLSLGSFFNFLTNSIFHYTSVSAIYQAYLYFRESQERAFRLQQAELQALKTQLHPHFLFNTLNAISSLSFSAPEVASRVIAQLSDLLRFSLKSEHSAEINLKEELDFVRKYLHIQQTLLEDRLEINWSIAPETLDAFVPNMFLQPLVENSIRHGIAPKEDGGSIEINSRRIGERLEIYVKDSGLGISPNGSNTSGDGIGLSNTRARLRHLYGEAHTFELSEAGTGSGVLIKMTIPFREGK